MAGFTGLVCRYYPRLVSSKKVDIIAVEAFDLSNGTTTTRERIVKRFKFETKFRALLFVTRLDAGQWKRYKF